MKLVFLADAPYIHARRWIGHFVARGDSCEVISFRPAEIAGARVHHIDGAEPLGKARYLVQARRVRRLIHELQPDLVHALHLTSYGFLGALSGFHPLVITPEGTDILEAPRLTPFHLWLSRYSLARADRITATGLHLATETTRYAPRDKPVTVVPYGVDLEVFRPMPLQQSRSEVVIGAASRFSPEKGVEHLVEAFAQIQSNSQPLRLRLAGDGPELEKVKRLAERLGITNQIDFLGWVDHEDLPAFLNALDIFVLPSIYEAFGVAAVEASACGLPVVASNVYGIPDVVRDGETGLLVPPAAPAALANAMQRLAADPELRQALGAAGREYVSQHYDWRLNARQMELVYDDLLSRRRQEIDE